MDLQTLRRQFIDKTGRLGLVGEDVNGDPDYAVDNGADSYINEGIRELDGLLPATINHLSMTLSLADAAYASTFPNLRSPFEVYASDGTSRWKLEKKTQRELRECYEKPFASVDSGSPLYWAISHKASTDTPSTATIINTMPPATPGHDIELIGSFYSEPLVDNADENWWTVNHSGLVILAALYCLEVSMRNTEGSKDWMQAISLRIRSIDHDLAEAESADKTEAEG